MDNRGVTTAPFVRIRAASSWREWPSLHAARHLAAGAVNLAVRRNRMEDAGVAA